MLGKKCDVQLFHKWCFRYTEASMLAHLRAANEPYRDTDDQEDATC